jgi:formylglycine-generating enzyme required for sulfatase activity
MRKVFAVAALALLCLGGMAQADVFNLGPGITNLEMVTVGDPGNVADTRYDSTGYGAVDHTYNIGKYEVTAAQYCDFLNHKAKSDPYGLYDGGMTGQKGCQIQRSGNSGSYHYDAASDRANRPVNYVNFWDACRFVNWLNNGQGDGDTETGAYNLNGYRDAGGNQISRNAEAKWYIPNEDEWYKAAYYKAGGTNAGYWDYPMQSDRSGFGCGDPGPVVVPSNDVYDPDPGNNANFYQDGYSLNSPHWMTNVGEFENSESAYGTFDQGGNVSEWNETPASSTSPYRVIRGGGFWYPENDLHASRRTSTTPDYTYYYSGFRVASAVPEPSTILTVLGGVTSLLALRRRKA